MEPQMRMVWVYGLVDIDQDMYLFLSQGPEVGMGDPLNQIQLEEYLRALTLIQYARYGLGMTKVVAEATIEELMEEQEVETKVFLATRTYNDINKTLTMANHRPTVMMTNHRVVIPSPCLAGSKKGYVDTRVGRMHERDLRPQRQQKG